MPDQFAQLQRCQSQELLDEVTGFLKQAGIPCKLMSTASIASTAWMGFKDQGSVAVMVPAGRLAEARAFLEEQYLRDELPADHYLHAMTAQDLSGLLADPDSWSAFDVAHARRLAQTKGVEAAEVEQLRGEITQERRLGKPAPVWILGAALVLAFLGPFAGAISIAISWSVAYMKENDAEGPFPTFNAASRRWAKGILVIATAMTWYSLVTWLAPRIH